MKTIGLAPSAPASLTCRQCGFTFLELLVATLLAALVALGLAALYGGTQQLLEDQERRAVAHEAAQAKLQELRSRPFDTLLDEYGSGTAGEWFEVPNLEVVEGDPAAGRVEFILNETLEEGDAALFGLPRDLNRDGEASSVDVGDSVTLLPVRITIRWPSSSGDGEVVLRQLLFDRPLE